MQLSHYAAVGKADSSKDGKDLCLILFDIIPIPSPFQT